MAGDDKDEEVEFVKVGESEIPILKQNLELNPGEIELSKDFEHLFYLCSLVESVGGATLPESGGWNNQDQEFIDCWLIYKGEKSRAESILMKRATNPE